MFTPQIINPCKYLIYKGLCVVCVIPTGFEPVTHRLEICCSIQLSYGTVDIRFLQIGCKCRYFLYYVTNSKSFF